MAKHSTDIVICGAGIAGISAAYFLSCRGIKNITLVDELPPLTLTSSRSTECYRNWWPDPEMLGLMNRSIDLLEELAEQSGNVFSMNRRGYLFVTADPTKILAMEKRARLISELGAGPVRIHTESSSSYRPLNPEGFSVDDRGADILLGSSLIRKHFSYLTEQAAAALHVRRAGWLSAQQLGMYMFETARKSGVQFLSSKVIDVRTANNRVESIHLSNGDVITSRLFVNAAGPYFKPVGSLSGIDLPVSTELHLKVAYNDPLGTIQRESPLLIWDDPQSLDWTDDERSMLIDDSETRWLTEPFPSGAHTRPEGGLGSQSVLMLWEYQHQPMDPIPDPPLDEYYPEVALRGMAKMIPAIRQYFGRSPRPQLDGGFYTKSKDNRPLVGPTDIKGYFILGGISGYGIMSACGVGELLAKHITGETLPEYASAFSLARFSDPAHLKWMESITDSGQL